ncbi:hypothetical protein [Puniceibacterium sp. IMCC21224]|uniref:hypothetical protein n=1 Tax=Puniceibacterium sp. IMCC21224 TaxID=1618204 RepID=UPI00064D9FD8|nr:hypothetical protein [Puniceibacterium sp. IMCC21224]KMK63796.1 hypothetical protein IMCC21224_1931 [Puniceibacterium sp. IMCC21224]
MTQPSPLHDDATRARANCLLIMAHALVAEADRIAGLLAEVCDLDPSSDQIIDAIWNQTEVGTGIMILRGDLPVRPDAEFIQ